MVKKINYDYDLKPKMEDNINKLMKKLLNNNQTLKLIRKGI